MALKTFVGGPAFFPSEALVRLNAGVNGTVDATGEAVAAIWRAPMSGTITALNFRLTAVTTGDTISAELQTVNSVTAIATDVAFAAGAGNSFSLTTTMASTWQKVTLATPAAVSIGEYVALVVKRNDTGGAGNFQITGLTPAGTILQVPPAATKVLTWATNATFMACIYPDFSGTVAPTLGRVLPYFASSVALSAGAAVDEVGNKFAAPFRARVSGFGMQMSFSAGAAAKVRLYDTDGTTVLASAILSNCMPSGGGLTWGNFLSAPVIAADSTYRIALFISAGAGLSHRLSAPDASAIVTLHMGSLCVATSRVNAGAWSDDTTARFAIGVMLDQLDDSSASGGAAGGLAHIIGGGL